MELFSVSSSGMDSARIRNEDYWESVSPLRGHKRNFLNIGSFANSREFYSWLSPGAFSVIDALVELVLPIRNTNAA